MSGFPREVYIQQTDEAAIADMDHYDPDAENEDSIPALAFEIASSMEPIKIESWEDFEEKRPAGYTLSNGEDASEYNEYLEQKEWLEEH